MTLSADEEPAIDMSLAHYMEERALAVALGKAATQQERVRLEHLLSLRGPLMARRDAFTRDATARRHARGEVYSKARVAAINAMGPTRSQLDEHVEQIYSCEPDSGGVLKAHARSHFVHGLVSARLRLADHTPDIADSAREMHRHEEEFASAWLAAIGDAAFLAELRHAQREEVRALRASTRPMHLATHPETGALDDADARVFGKAWNKLDELALALGVEPLSAFIALPGEEGPAGLPAGQMLPTLTALLGAVQGGTHKLPSKQAVAAALAKAAQAVARLAQEDGHAAFEIDL